MDNRPIGVFDSGLGGLTAVKELAARLPGEQIVFFGDTGRVPYGTRSAPTIVSYALEDLAVLERYDVKCCIVACGTVSANAMPQLKDAADIPVWGVVEHAASAAARASKTGRIGVIGTKASIRSGTYEKLIRELRPDAQCTCAACPLLVPLVENGRFSPDDPVVDLVLREYLSPILSADVDVLIMGCTHYPLLQDAISRICGEKITLVDPGRETAYRVAEILKKQDLCAAPSHPGGLTCFVSDDPQGFSENGSRFLGRAISAQLTQCK